MRINKEIFEKSVSLVNLDCVKSKPLVSERYLHLLIVVKTRTTAQN
jgi:hypothetical protein